MPEDGVFIHTDPSALTRILENLLSNAIRYSDGEIRTGITESDDSIAVFVANSSVHIDGSTDLNLLFDRFYVADRSRTKKSTGLGLSIAQSLVEKTGGIIRADYERHMIIGRGEWPKSRAETDLPHGFVRRDFRRAMAWNERRTRAVTMNSRGGARHASSLHIMLKSYYINHSPLQKCNKQRIMDI